MDTHRRIVFILLFVIIGMFSFSFALIPLYSVFCKVTGLNGKVDLSKDSLARYQDPNLKIQDRLITVEFDVNLHPNLNCEFHPNKEVLQVRPGELTLTSYHIKNLSPKTVVIQAIPSISPGIVAKHLKKLECFCFNNQTLKPGESMDLPLRFWLENEIPENTKRLTLSYTLFDVTEMKRRN